MDAISAEVNPAELCDNAHRYYDWRDPMRRKRGKRRVKFTPAVARYEQVARDLRDRILAGEWAPDVTLPGAPAVARDYGVTQSVAQRAMETLVSWRLARVGARRGTVVARLRDYRAEASLPWTLAGAFPAEAIGALRDALEAAIADDPQVRSVEAETARTEFMPEARVIAVIVTSGPGHAAARLDDLARISAPKGWDMASATVTAWPA